MRLTEILANAIVVSQGPKKSNDKNQKSFSKMYVLKYENVKLVVGYQKTKGEYVQYSITWGVDVQIKK